MVPESPLQNKKKIQQMQQELEALQALDPDRQQPPEESESDDEEEQ